MEILTNCRFCDGPIRDVIHIGDTMPLAGGFMRSIEEFKSEKLFPLDCSFCDKCHLLQCKQIIPSNVLFEQGYFYKSSMIKLLREHFTTYAEMLKNSVDDPKNFSVYELGCNDGVFLKPLAQQGFNVIGIDPSNCVEQLIKEKYTIYNEYFNEELAERIISKHGKCDFFVSSNSFAHINDMNSIMKGIKKILAPNGTAIVEVHYSKSIIEEMQFDFIYHEHMSYYTVDSMNQIVGLYNFTIDKIEFTTVHGSSMRLFIKHGTGTKKEIEEIITGETHLRDLDTYKSFNENLMKWKQDILSVLKDYDLSKVYGYGSSGRTNMILSFLGIKLGEIIDDAPSKIGSFMPVFHQEIKGVNVINESPPDLVIILCWPYAKDVLKTLRKIYSGPILIPLPNILLFSKVSTFYSQLEY